MVKSVIRLTVFFTVIAAVGAAANPIGYGFTVYVDENGYDAHIVDQNPALITLYVVAYLPEPATAVQFSAPKPACFLATYLDEHTPFPIRIGNSQYDVAIAFGTCISTPQNVLTILYFGEGLTGDCCLYPLDMGADDPAGIPGHITYTDCSDPPEIGNFRAGSSVVNWIPGCDSPVEQSTWGHVKSLYKP